MITEIAFFCYPVSDMAKARHFYEQILGLKVGMNYEDQWVEYDVQGIALAITSMDPSRKPGLKSGVVAFEVDDFEATIAGLKEKQVKFIQPPMATPVCHLAVIADPDDNDIIIHKRKG